MSRAKEKSKVCRQLGLKIILSIAKAREYNSDLDNELYIFQVKDCSQTPNHTTCLTQVRAEKTTNDFNIRARDLKYSNVGNNPWDNVYLIPTLEF